MHRIALPGRHPGRVPHPLPSLRTIPMSIITIMHSKFTVGSISSKAHLARLLFPLQKQVPDCRRILKHPGLDHFSVSHPVHPKCRKNDPSSTSWCYRLLLPEHNHSILSGFKEDRGTWLPGSWPERVPGPVVAIEMAKGFCMPVIIASIRQRGRFVNHNLWMVCLQHTRLVTLADGGKQTLHR